MGRRELILMALIAASLALPGAELAAQQPTAWVMPRGAAPVPETGPFAELLEHRGEVGLSDAQVRSIREVARRLAQENEPLLAQIRDAEVWGVETEAEEAAIAAVRERFREAALAAGGEVEALLTEEQLQRVRGLLGDGLLAFPAQPADEEEEAEAGELATKVTVENHFFNDVTIYVHRGAMRQRLGRVTGLRTLSFDLPASWIMGLTTLQFEIRPLAQNRSAWSEQVLVQPGDDVRLRIPASLR
jgi:hypothetical protein